MEENCTHGFVGKLGRPRPIQDIVLKLILRRKDGKGYGGFIWLRIQTMGGLL